MIGGGRMKGNEKRVYSLLRALHYEITMAGDFYRGDNEKDGHF